MSVSLEAIVRDFPGTRALDQVSCDFGFDEVHGLIGENGAGKSTLMNILAGSLPPSSGKLSIDGQAQHFTSPRDALIQGIALVSQEGSLVPSLSGTGNILLGDEPRRFGILRRSALKQRAEALMRQWFPGVEIDLDLPVEALAMADRKLIEIVRALCRNIRLLILDEPTATLQAREKALLWTILRALPTKGVGVVLISHFLSEVKALSHRITVLRDGTLRGTFSAAALSEADMVELMLKRGLSPKEKMSGARILEPKSPILTVDGWQVGKVQVPAFKIHPGEIVGLIGLTGAGHFGFARSLYAGTGVTQGRMTFGGRLITRPAPRLMQRLGMGFVPDQRMENALIPEGTIVGNLSLIHPEAGSKGGLINPRQEAREARKVMEKFNLRAHSGQIVKTLSGGNKQKVSLGKWLYGAQDRYRLFIFIEPTEGVDIGVKQEIHRYLHSFAEQGVAILLASSDLLEIERLCHRAIAFVRGKPSQEINAKEFSEARFIEAMTGETA